MPTRMNPDPSLSGILDGADRILIIRPSAIGDIVMASPLLGALRRARPRAHLAWLVEPALAPLLVAHPDLDELVVWPKGLWKQGLAGGRWFQLGHEIKRFARALRQHRFDLVLDVQGLLRSRCLAWLSGAPQRIGFASREPGGRLMTRVVSRGPESKEMSSEYKHLAVLLGLDPGRFAPHLRPAEEAQRRARSLLSGAGVNQDYLVLCPFTTRPQKHWREERWAELSRRLRIDYPWPVVMLGGAQDRPAARRVGAAAGAPLVNLVGRTDLGTAAAIVEHARLVIGVDTGLSHMAVAFQRPLVALFGSTCPYLNTSRADVIVLHAGLDCSPCRRRPTCDERYPCMAAIEVDTVLAAGARALTISRSIP